MDIKVTDSEAAFELPEWHLLLEGHPHPHIFATPEWNRLWWQKFGKGKRLEVLTFLDPDPVGLVAIMYDEITSRRRIRFLGGDDLTDYLGPLSAGTAPMPAVAEALLHYLKENQGWDIFDAKCMPVPFGFADWLVEAADRLGFGFAIDEHEVSAVLNLPTTFDEYVESLPPKARHELRRKMRRFDEQATGATFRPTSASTIEADVAEFIELHKQSEGNKGKFFQPRGRSDFFKSVAATFEPSGMVALDFLELDGRPIASTFSLLYKDVFYLYNSTYDHNLKKVSPGLILAVKLIERQISAGTKRFDFLRGRERYKFELGAQALPLHAVRLTPVRVASPT